MDRPEDLINGVLVGTIFQYQKVFYEIFMVFPGFSDKQ
jgi:hypothetical protein